MARVVKKDRTVLPVTHAFLFTNGTKHFASLAAEMVLIRRPREIGEMLPNGLWDTMGPSPNNFGFLLTLLGALNRRH